MTNQPFIPGRELSRQLAEFVEPRLRKAAPGVQIALALIGAGSDVLGYDTARSMDHDWGPRLTVIVPESHRKSLTDFINNRVHDLMPAEIGGFPTRFSHHEDGTLFADASGPIHRLGVESVQSLLLGRLLIDRIAELTDAVWLSTPMQSLLELTSGEVFVDDDGEVSSVRTALAFYPDHLWRYQLAGMWMRVSQIQPFLGRTAEVGDELGSAQIATSLSRDFMRIALLQSKQYARYSKWLGTARENFDSHSGKW